MAHNEEIECRCSECDKDLYNNDGSFTICLPRSQGPTHLRPNGLQCSIECYNKAREKRIDELKNIKQSKEK